MNLQNLETYCQVLESGFYPQGKGMLYVPIWNMDMVRTDTYCALGVGCKLINLPQQLADLEHDSGFIDEEGELWSVSAPHAFANWLGLDIDDPLFDCIAWWNDETKMTFPEIAAEIRHYITSDPLTMDEVTEWLKEREEERELQSV